MTADVPATSDAQARRAWRRWLAPIALAVATLALYVFAATDDIVAGDNAEFSTLAQLGGAAHPSGYPLYVLWLRATSWLPGTTPAHSAAIATALLGVAAVLVLRAACRAWGARPGAATAAAAIVAAAPVVLRVHVAAEVFALNDLIVALVLWLAAAQGPLRGVWRGAALGLVAGLGIADHLTCVLVAPVGILGVVRATREARIAPSRRWRSLFGIAVAVGGLVAGLTPYLYLFVAPDTDASWGTVRTLGELVRMVTRDDYGGLGAFGPHGLHADVGANLVALARSVARAWAFVPVIGLGLLVARPRGESRWAWALLAASWLLAGPILAARFDVAPVGVGRLVCERFHVLPVILLTLPAALLLDRMRFPGYASLRSASGASQPQPLHRLASLARPPELSAVALVVVLGAIAIPHQRAIASPAVEADVVNLLRALPERAVVIHASDELYFGGIYVQHLLGIRRDVTLVSWAMAVYPWYRARVLRDGVDLALPPPEVPAQPAIAARILASGRPVFCQPSFGQLIAAFANYPHGAVFRLLPPGVREPTLDEVVAVNEKLFAAFEPVGGGDDGYADEIHARYAEVWIRLAAALEREGRVSAAEGARQRAQTVK